jgi:hypothetical protein
VVVYQPAPAGELRQLWSGSSARPDHPDGASLPGPDVRPAVRGDYVVEGEAPGTVIEQWVERYADDPVLFVQEVLGADPDPWQADVMRAYAARERQISLRSGHGPGKTTVLAWVIDHQLLFRFPQKTVATAPTEAQLFDALFAEVKAWITKLPPRVQELLEVKSDRIELRAAKDESFFTVRTARAEKPEALAGVHSSGWVLLIGDEASGIAEVIFEAASGSMSGHNATTILAGNPVRTTGLFYDTHHKLRDKWRTFHISCLDSPRVSKQFVEDMRDRYGENSNAFRVRVLGEFPRAGDNTIIPIELIEQAMGSDVLPIAGAPSVWGLDVAYTGDDRTALVKRRGNAMLERPKWKRGLDPRQVAGWVKQEWDATVLSERPSEIMVDVIGFGAGVVARLQELQLPAVGINVANVPALTQGQYPNLRTELWFEARAWFTSRAVVIPQKLRNDDPVMEDFIEELAAQTYEPVTSGGKTAATAKKAMKKILGRSPDLADAFLLTFASSAGRALFGVSGTRTGSWGPPLRRLLKGVV